MKRPNPTPDEIQGELRTLQRLRKQLDKLIITRQRQLEPLDTRDLARKALTEQAVIRYKT